MAPPMRLVDLHTDWLLQYAPETTVFDPALYPEVTARLGQAEGYLQATRIAVLACYRRAEDWARQADPWAALAALIARIEAEFCGRVLYGPNDLARCLSEDDMLCWAMIGVEGFDALVWDESDLDRLAALYERGVRLFQPVYTATNGLAGSAMPGDDRGLTDLGRAFLQRLADLTGGARPAIDLAHLNPRSAAEVLDWLEADPARAERLVPVYSHGAPWHPGFENPRGLSPENLVRLRALGGVIGMTPAFFASPEALQAAIEAAAAVPFRGRPGLEGLAIGTDFLGVDESLPGLGHAAEVVAWCESAFGREGAALLVEGNGLALVARILGGGLNDPLVSGG